MVKKKSCYMTKKVFGAYPRDKYICKKGYDSHIKLNLVGIAYTATSSVFNSSVNDSFCSRKA